jgi:hypothetical protein
MRCRQNFATGRARPSTTRFRIPKRVVDGLARPGRGRARRPIDERAGAQREGLLERQDVGQRRVGIIEHRLGGPALELAVAQPEALRALLARLEVETEVGLGLVLHRQPRHVGHAARDAKQALADLGAAREARGEVLEDLAPHVELRHAAPDRVLDHHQQVVRLVQAAED